MPFRIATFNALNLNLASLGFIGRLNARPLTAEEYAAKTGSIATELTALAPDIVGFQEVFSEAALRDACSQSPGLGGMTVHAPLAKPVPDPLGPAGDLVSDGPHVGIASRFPLSGPPSMITDFRPEAAPVVPLGRHSAMTELHLLGITAFERPLLRAEIEVDGLPGLVVLVAHLKSKRPKFLPGEDLDDPIVQALGAMRSLIVRACEAAALRAQVVAERDSWVAGKRRPVVVLGDLNDDLDSVTTQMICGGKPYLSNGQTTVSRSTWRFRTKDMMLSAFELAMPPIGQGHTHVFGGKASVIDHILMSADFAPVEGRQRARVVATGTRNAHLAPIVAGAGLPPVEPFDPVAIQAKLREEAERPPRDQLLENPRDARTEKPELGFDHGFPFADVELFPGP